MTQPINHVIDADIKGFFDNVSHAWLMKFLQVRIKDPSFLLLIQRFLKAGYLEAGQIVATEQGTPQGGNLSPMLSNIFLHYVLDLWFEKRIKRQVRGACFLVRYADDFVCMVQYQDDAQHDAASVAGAVRAVRSGVTPGEDARDQLWPVRTAERPAAETPGEHLRLPGLHPLLRHAVAGGSSSSDARPAGRSSARSAKS